MLEIETSLRRGCTEAAKLEVMATGLSWQVAASMTSSSSTATTIFVEPS